MWFPVTRKSRRISSAARPAQRYPLMLETLEDRCLLAVGVVGDSISYLFTPGGTGHNWVDQLAQLRGIDFGSTTYSNVWSGPNTYGALAVAAPGLANQIATGTVQQAVVE